MQGPVTRTRRRVAALIACGAVAIGGLGCAGSDDDGRSDASPAEARTDPGAPAAKRSNETRPRGGPRDVYAHTRPGMFRPEVEEDLERVYVPNSDANTVSVIDPGKGKVVDSFAVGALPHHITPSHDLKTFYVDNTAGNSLTPIDPRTAKPKGRPIPVDDPYNLYFTPDGRSAIVVAERLQRLDFRDPRTWRMQKSVPAGCAGVDHMDFSADGRRGVASCEFDGTLLLVDLGRQEGGPAATARPPRRQAR